MTSSWVRRKVRAALYAGITTTIFWPFNIDVVEYAFVPEVATSMTIFHDPRSTEYSVPGHPERPERITRTVPLLKDRHPGRKLHEPHAATDEAVSRPHSHEHPARIPNASDGS